MKRIHPPLRETLSLLLAGAAGVGCGATDGGENSASRDVANQEESTPMAPQPESTEMDDGTAETDDGTAETHDPTPPQSPTPAVVEEVAAATKPATRCPDPADDVVSAPELVAALDAGAPEPTMPAVDPAMDVPGAAYPDCGDAGYPDCIRG